MYFLIITEANQKVATGHFMEVCELAREFIKRGHEIRVLVNRDCPADLFKRLPCAYSVYDESLSKVICKIIEIIQNECPDVIITNLREIHNEDIQRIKSVIHKPLICIDEFGNRKMECDAIINPMVDSAFWKYPDSPGKLYAGHQYLVLPETIREYHDKDKRIEKTIKRICVSMGGVDPLGTTVKIVKWLPRLFESVNADVILGAGFTYQEEIEEAIQILPQTISVHVQKNIRNIYEFFFEADLAFSAGGNTLHELACIGIPTIVIPTMIHEKRNGDCFEKMGTAKSLSLSESITIEEVESTIEEMTFEKRRDMSRCGKDSADGKGALNTLSACMEIVKEFH